MDAAVLFAQHYAVLEIDRLAPFTIMHLVLVAWINLLYIVYMCNPNWFFVRSSASHHKETETVEDGGKPENDYLDHSGSQGHVSFDQKCPVYPDSNVPTSLVSLGYPETQGHLILGRTLHEQQDYQQKPIQSKEEERGVAVVDSKQKENAEGEVARAEVERMKEKPSMTSASTMYVKYFSI